MPISIFKTSLAAYLTAIAAIRKCAQLWLFVVLNSFALEELAYWADQASLQVEHGAEQVEGEGFHALKRFHVYLLSGRFSEQLGKVPVVVTSALK